ncbi:hypothetical protein HDV00_003224 [Rhizophlyctis rosea]|nr:hypothetical protein HDV00_003224 [Rhizophlyctis rosea]
MFVTGSVDGNVRVWEPSGRCKHILAGNGRPVTHVAVNARKNAVGAIEGGTILIWDINLGGYIDNATPAAVITEVSRTIAATSPALQAVYLDPTNSRALIVYAEGAQPVILDIQTGSVQCTLVGGHSAAITASSWDKLSLGVSERNTSILVTGDETGTVCMWELQEDARSGSVRPLRTIDAHAASISQIQLDAYKLVSASIDGGLKVFDLMTGRCLRTLGIRHLKGGNHGFNQGNVDRRKVARCLSIGEYYIVAGLGDHIKTWNFAPQHEVEAMTASKNAWKHRTTANSRRQSGSNPIRAHRPAQPNDYTPKQQLLEIRDQVRDLNWERDYEREVAEHRSLQQRRVNGVSVGGQLGDNMSEEDLLRYAEMVSMEEHERVESDRDLMMALELSRLELESAAQAAQEESSGGQEDGDGPSGSRDDWEEDWEEGGLGTRYTYGSSASSSRDFSPRSPQGAAAEFLKRSPHLAPQRGQSSSSKVTVVQRPEWEEDEELQYVLELSKVEH